MPALRAEIKSHWPHIVLALLTILAILALTGLLGSVWSKERGDLSAKREVEFQFADGHSGACRLIYPDHRRGCPAKSSEVRRYVSAVQADWYLVAGYTLLLAGVFGVGALYLSGSGARRVARWCLGGVLLVGAADAGENLALLRGLADLGQTRDFPFAAAAALSVLKFAVLGPLLPVGAVIILVLRRPGIPGIVGKRSRVRRDDGRLPDIVTASELDSMDSDRRPDVVSPPAVADTSTGTLSATVERPASDVQQQLYTPEGQKKAKDEAAKGLPDHPHSDLPGPVATRWCNAGRVPPGRPPAKIGICASGGGIRSACVTLGALQALREKDILSKARYLVSVSGGGYMAGAFQLALTQAKTKAESLAKPEDVFAPGSGKEDHLRRHSKYLAESLASPEDVFAPGSAEEDHLRRHSKYLADGFREWLTALAVVLRGVIASLGLLTLVVVVAGVALNAFYQAAPVVNITELLPRFDPSFNPDPSKPPPSEPAQAAGFPTPPQHAWWTLTVGAAVAVIAWIGVMVGLHREELWWATAFRYVFRVVVTLTAAVAVYALVVPAVVWAMARLTWWVPDQSPVSATSFTTILTILLTWFGALASTLWRRTKKIRPSGDKTGGLGGLFGRKDRGEVVEQQVATGLGQRLIVWAVLAVLGFVFTFVLAWTTASAHRWWSWLGPALLGVLLVVAFLVDQTWLGLHLFYRRRLASAFGVRRAHMPDGGTGALAYRLEEPTTLSTYGEPVHGFPQVIFAGAAALSGQSRTPPGRRAVSFTLSSDYIGGPDVGWVRTNTLETTCKPAVRRDVTVQAAMAVSGAAFASAMGRHATAVQTLLALSNVRLGTWLPNPGFLAALERPGASWRTPRLPAARRLPYLLREIFGAYPAEGRMLLCTDGGHYENLGLVELLRHRCRTIYCIDASGDSPPFAATLAEAITLAYEELGVKIILEGATDLVPGSGTTLEPSKVLMKITTDLAPGSATALAPSKVLERLNARLSKRSVITGRIEYPEAFRVPPEGEPSKVGRLVVAKAVLTPDMPYELLSYALKETVFPRQSTSDQFFNHEQFDAYRALGYYIGTCAAEVGTEESEQPTAPSLAEHLQEFARRYLCLG